MLDILQGNGDVAMTIADCCATETIFVAPEISVGAKCCGKADVWSVGVILYLLVIDGKVKASEGGTSAMAESQFSFNEQAWSTASQNIKQFVSQCLQVNVDNRPSIDTLMTYELMRWNVQG